MGYAGSNPARRTLDKSIVFWYTVRSCLHKALGDKALEPSDRPSQLQQKVGMGYEYAEKENLSD